MPSVHEPLFHVLLSDRDQWVVEVEWPDGVLERIRSFEHYATAAHWVTSQSQVWLQVQGIFGHQTVDSLVSPY